MTDPPLVLVDVDVILDVLTRREPFVSDSAALLAACETGRCRGLVAAHTVTAVSYLRGKHRDAAYACRQLAELLRIVHVASVDAEVIDRALTSAFGDFEDAVQMAAAVAAGADYVATRNVKDFSAGPLPAITPAELLPLLRPGV